MGVTLKDLSEKLNMSMTSISLVLNNRPNRISQAKRELILKTAREMNYVTSTAAKRRQLSTLGLILPDISNPFFAQLAEGVDACAAEKGWNVIVCNSHDKAERDLEAMRLLSSCRADAIIMVIASSAGPEQMANYTRTIADFGRQVILVDRYTVQLDCNTVTINHLKGAYQSAQHLLNLGHRKLMCITGPTSLHNTQERIKGVEMAMKEHGLTPSGETFLEGDFTVESGYRLADQVASAGATALFCGNDLMAFGACKRLKELGLRIPHDISVVGFDDVPFAEFNDPPLTTVRQPAMELGQKAAELAFRQAEDPHISHQALFLEPDLVIRKSTTKLKKPADETSCGE